MGLGEAGLSAGDVMRRLRDLEQQIRDLQTARRLEAASIGGGGLRVKDGGRIQILDQAGEVALDLAASGLTVSGAFEFVDANGDVRALVTGREDGSGANLVFRSGPDAQQGGEVLIGTLVSVATQEVVGNGLLVQQQDGKDIFVARSLPGVEGRLTMRYFNADEGAMFVVDDEGDDRLALNTPTGDTAVWLDEDGIRRPRLPVHWVVGSFGDTVSNGGGITTVAEGYPVRTYPQMRITYRVNILSGSPTFRVRLRDTIGGADLLGWQTHSTGGYHSHNVTLLGDPRETRLHRLEAEVTSGTGEVRVAMVRATVGLH